MNRRNMLTVLGGGGLVTVAGVATAVADVKPPAKGDATLDWSEFPKLTGKVKQMLGHSSGYIPPEAGEPFHLDFRDVPKLTSLVFDQNRKSYVPLPGPITVEIVNRYSNGAFQSMRLASKRKDRDHVVTIDVVPHPGRRPNYVEVWVVIQSQGVVTGVALIETDFEGTFPDRVK